MDCQKIEHWVLFEDGEKSLNESRQLREHLSMCARCAELHQKALGWINQWSLPAGELSVDTAVANVLARLDERTARARRASGRTAASHEAPGPGSKNWLEKGSWLGVALSAAALSLVVGSGILTPGGGDATGSEEFGVRGARLGALSSLRRQVGVSFHVVNDMLELRSGDTLQVGDAIVGSYVNLGLAEPVYALSFAKDALGEVHWLYPAYLNASDDPAAVVVPDTAGDELLMPEAVVVDAAPGPFSIFTITSHQLLRVSQIESLPAESFTSERLSQALPAVEVSELTLHLVR